MKPALAWACMLLCLTAIAATPATAQHTLVLQNGDRLSGTLTGIDGGVWVFKHAAGQLKIATGQVTSFTTANPIGIRLMDGTIVAARVSTSDGRLQLAADDGSTRTVTPADLAAVGDPANLAALVPVRIGYFTPIRSFWGATANLGFSNKSGNSRNRSLAATVEVGRWSPRDRLTLKLGIAREESDPGTGDLETTVGKYYGSARVDVFLRRRLFVFGTTAQERDEFQGIDLRSNYNAGLGVQILSSDMVDLRFYASGGLRREAFTSGNNSSTGIVAAGAAFKHSLGPAVFAWTVDWAPSINDFADYRLVSDASVTTTMFHGLGFRIASRNEINNRPPRPEIEKHDMLLTATLTYSIGR